MGSQSLEGKKDACIGRGRAEERGGEENNPLSELKVKTVAFPGGLRKEGDGN